MADPPTDPQAQPPPPAANTTGWQADFPLPRVLGRLQRAAQAWQTPALELVAAQSGDSYAVLVGTVLSLRTRDATTLAALGRLRAVAPSVPVLAGLDPAVIAEAIRPVAFYRVKAGQLQRMAALIQTRHGGQVPADLEALLALPGVGRKTANLVLGLGFGVPAVCVDTHVHRILNRLGALKSRDPEQTEHLLRQHLHRRWWLRVNAVLVPFGQTLCTPQSPWCSRCPVQAACHRVGVGRSR